LCIPSSQVLWVNFYGGAYSYSSAADPSSDTNYHNIDPAFTGDFGGFGGTVTQHNAILGMVVQDFHDFQVTVTTEEPPPGSEYAEVAFVAGTTIGQGVLGLTAMNCYDANPNPLGFITITVDTGLSDQQVANAVGGIAGQMFGVERISFSGDLMNQYLEAGNSAYLDDCGPGANPFVCEHTAGACAEGNQNSYRELEQRFGLR
jgi:hypothetical protein